MYYQGYIFQLLHKKRSAWYMDNQNDTWKIMQVQLHCIYFIHFFTFIAPKRFAIYIPYYCDWQYSTLKRDLIIFTFELTKSDGDLGPFKIWDGWIGLSILYDNWTLYGESLRFFWALQSLVLEILCWIWNPT